ncbi:hypothetical protein THAOC_37207, partial [Thalassiosira oceanica]
SHKDEGGEPSSSLQSALLATSTNNSREDSLDCDRDRNKSRNGGRGKDDIGKPKAKNSGPSHRPVQHRWRLNDSVRPDERLGQQDKDPRGDDPTKRIAKKKAGRNTESFDPGSTLVRPDLRVLVGNPSKSKFDKPLKHDDVVIVPELFGDEDDWDTYYQLVEEMRDLQKENPKSAWVSWHEGALASRQMGVLPTTRL